MTKIVFEPIDDHLERTKVAFMSKDWAKDEYVVFYQFGALKQTYQNLTSILQRQHNDELPRMKQGEDAIRLLKEIAENAVHSCGTDYRIDEKWILKIEELLKSE